MKLFKLLKEKAHEKVVIFGDKDLGLNAIIAIHDTTLGPALGGCRMWGYNESKNPLYAGMLDALKLSMAMTYKASAAGLDLGGGKAVIVKDPSTISEEEREKIFIRFGEFVESLNGKYITAEDVGTNVKDMANIMKSTKYVVGIPEEYGGSSDPSPVTAYGVFMGIKACLKEVFGTESLEGKIVAIEGVGNVGYNLAKYLYKEGAELIVSDIVEEKAERAAKEFNAKITKPGKIYEKKCHIFSPCALGGSLNSKTIPKLRCKIVAGAANNQLKNSKSDGERLAKKGILYAPDYVINAGGLINVSMEPAISGKPYDREKTLKKVENIYYRLLEIFKISKEKDIPTNVAADLMAEERIIRARKK